MREYYIRREGDEDASGPFDIDQISSLIEADKLDPSAYYYDIESESWLLISSNQELMDTLFPKKRKLSLRTAEVEAEQKRQAEEEAAKKAAEAEAAKTEGEADGETEDGEATAETGEKKESDAKQDSKDAKEKKKKDKKDSKKGEDGEQKPEKIDVTRMLALAEGRENDSSGKSPREKQAAVAFFGLRFLTLFFIASILAMVYIEKDLVMTANAIQMAKSPYLLIAAFDLLVLVTLLLQVTEVYPLLRFRAAIGAGLLSMLYFSSGDTILLVSNLFLMIAVYFCSAIIKIRYLIVFGATGLVGILGYVYVFFLT